MELGDYCAWLENVRNVTLNYFLACLDCNESSLYESTANVCCTILQRHLTKEGLWRSVNIQSDTVVAALHTINCKRLHRIMNYLNWADLTVQQQH